VGLTKQPLPGNRKESPDAQAAASGQKRSKKISILRKVSLAECEDFVLPVRFSRFLHSTSAVQNGPLLPDGLRPNSPALSPARGEWSTASNGKVLQRVIENLQQTDQVGDLDALVKSRFVGPAREYSGERILSHSFLLCSPAIGAKRPCRSIEPDEIAFSVSSQNLVLLAP